MVNYSVENSQMKYKLEDAFPNAPESFEKRIRDTMRRLPSKPRRNLKKASIAVAASITLILAVLVYFMANPALAANVPIINEMVYQLSAAVEPDERTKSEVMNAVSAVLNDFYAPEDSYYYFDASESLKINNDTLIMAYYLQYQAFEAGILNDGKILTATQIKIESIEQKGFRISAKLKYNLSLDGKNTGVETIDALLEKTSTGMVITAFSGNSDAFRSYAKEAVQYAKERDITLNNDAMTGYNVFLFGELENQKNIEEGEKLYTAEEKSMGNVAVQLRYQFYLAKKTHKLPDLSKLIEKNENTELFFYAMELEMNPVYKNQLLYVKPGSFSIEEKTIEKDGSIKLNIYVNTNIEGGVGEELVLTLKKTENGFLIIGYDEGVNTGSFQAMKDIVEDLMKKDKSLSKSEANRLAYDEIKELQESKRDWLKDHPEFN